jgi:hypothetical protein
VVLRSLFLHYYKQNISLLTVSVREISRHSRLVLFSRLQFYNVNEQIRAEPGPRFVRTQTTTLNREARRRKVNNK